MRGNSGRIKARCINCKIDVTRTHQISMHCHDFPEHIFDIQSHELDKYGFPI